jgi:hypothetical protein
VACIGDGVRCLLEVQHVIDGPCVVVVTISGQHSEGVVEELVLHVPSVEEQLLAHVLDLAGVAAPNDISHHPFSLLHHQQLLSLSTIFLTFTVIIFIVTEAIAIHIIISSPALWQDASEHAAAGSW